MRNIILLFVTLILFPLSVSAQELDAATLAKRAGRKNLTIKEWNTDAKSKTRWLDRVTTYDQLGRVEREVEYDDRDKPVIIRKFEYNDDGTKNGNIIMLRTES